MHHARFLALCALVPVLSCQESKTTVPALRGQLVLETFPFAAPEGVAVSSTGRREAAPVAPDGAFALALAPDRYRVYFRESGTPLEPGTRAALVYPRADGTIDREVAVVAGEATFDLGSVRYLGEMPDHFHFVARAGARRYHGDGVDDDECEHGVDAHGEPCIDDHEEDDCEDGHDGHEGEHEDDGHADDDPHGEDDHHVCVPEHSPPHHIGCDPHDDDIDGGAHEDEGPEHEDEGVGHDDEGPGHDEGPEELDGGVDDEGGDH